MKLFLAQKKSVNYVLEAKSSLENDTITIPIETNYYLLKINFYVFFLFYLSWCYGCWLQG
jgi:hypothetical protein